MAQNFGYDIDSIANAPMWAKEDTQLRIEEILKAGKGLPKKTKESIDELGDVSKSTAKRFDQFASGLESMVDGAANVAGSFLDTSGRIDSLNPVVDTLSTLLQTGIKAFGNLFPIVGDGLGQLGALGVEVASTVVQAIATELDEVATGFRSIASRGAVLNGNIMDITEAAGRAGFGIENLSEILDNNASVLMAFGDASVGAERVLKNLAALRQSELYTPLRQLGFTVEGLADVAGQYYETLVRTGRLEMLQAGNEAEVARQTGEYAKNLALISRLTGRNVKEIQDEIRERQQEGFIIVSNRQIAQRSGQEVLNVVNAASSLFNDPELNKAIRMTLTDIGLAGRDFESLFTQFPQARAVLSEFQTGLREGTITEQEAKGFLDELIQAFKVEGQGAIDLSAFSPYTSSEFIQAINSSAAAIVDFSNSTDKNLDTADGAIEKFLTSSENNINEIIKLEDENRRRGLEFQLTLAQNVSELSDEILAAYGKINEIMMAFVDPEKDVLTVVSDIAKDMVGSLKEAMGDKIETAYQNIDNAIIEMTGGEDGFVVKGREIQQDVDQYLGGVIRSLFGMTPDGGKFVDAFENEGGDIGYWENLIESFKRYGSYQSGTPGVVDFGEGQLAALHGKEAVIPAPEGNIPVDLGTDVKNALATSGLNSVQSNAKLDEMISVLKAIADGQVGVMKTQSRGFKKLGNNMTGDLYRLN